MMDYYIGVDAGTSSVRAALFNDKGHIKSMSVVSVQIWHLGQDLYEQSSANVWHAVSTAIKEVIEDTQLEPSHVKGLGFDATCSLVVLDDHMKPRTVTNEGNDYRNIIMWMDHRAHKEAEAINATNHKILETVGGSMSLEMQLPKLLWLKKHLPNTWKKAGYFFDLPDFLTWKATGSLSRSACSLGCKWSYQTRQGSWDAEFLSLIGLGDLAVNQQMIGTEVKNIGSSCGEGLSSEAAEELGLCPGTPVGTSMIDAHAGALGCLSCRATVDGVSPSLDNKLVLIAGTSSCHIVCSHAEIPVKGVWGPYYNAIFPGMWVNEGGQSAAGSLIDFMVTKHEMYPHIEKQASGMGIHPHTLLNNQLYRYAGEDDCSNVAFLTKHLHVWPDFHGNRSPLADPTLKGMISGLDLSTTQKSVALLYLAAIQALAYGTKSILKTMEDAGHSISSVYVCGGLSKNETFVKMHADVLELPIIIPRSKEPVLMGSAILGMCASGTVSDIQSAMSEMGGKGDVIVPNPDTASYHKKKYAVFMEMLKDQKKYKGIMDSNEEGIAQN